MSPGTEAHVVPPLRPIVDPPIYDAMPSELKELPQWVFWRFVLRQNKKTGESYWTKAPYGAGSTSEPKAARANDPRSWLTFDVAKTWMMKHLFDGIGFEFHPDGPYFGIDLDDCRDPQTGAIERNAMDIVRLFDTYTEISPSKTGIKLIGRGRLNLPPQKNGNPSTGRRVQFVWSSGRVGELECYDRARYFAMTGNVLAATSTIADCQKILPEWFPETFPADRGGKSLPRTAVVPNGEAGPDADVFAKAKAARGGESFARLVAGDISEYADDPSRADLAFCRKAAFWVGPNPSRIDALLRQTGLYRDKWDRDDYRDRTISLAIDGATAFYDWNRNNRKVQTPGDTLDDVEAPCDDDHEHKPREAPVTWPDPKPLPSGIPPVEIFDTRWLPDPFENWALDAAERTQAPVDFVACASMVALSAVVGRRIQIRPKRQDDWTVTPNLWGMAVGAPGVMKTQAIQEGFRPLTRLEIEAGEKYEQQLKSFAAQELIAAAQKNTAKKAIEKALVNGDPARAKELAESAVDAEVEPPKRRRYLCSDATVEKLGEILSVNPNGVGIMRDELVGLWRSLDREGQEAARAFYLEAWNGDGRFVYDRIGRGTVVIPNVCLSIFGTIQPGPLGDYQRAATRNGNEADGLLQRFQIGTWPDVSKEWVNVDRWPDSEAKDLAYSVFVMLDGLNPDLIGAKQDERDPEGVPYLRFDDPAQDAFDAWRASLEPRLRNDVEHPAIASHLAKYRSLVPSLALLIHLAEAETFGAIGLPALVKALEWAKYLESHARRIFAASIGDDQGARTLADKIIDGQLGDEFTARQVHQRHWSGLTAKEDVEDAVGLLTDLGWLHERVEKTGGRPKSTFAINPKIERRKSQVNADNAV